MKVDRLSSILSQIVSVGEHEKVVQGIFENYPNTKYRDASMRVVRGLKLFQQFLMVHTTALVPLLHSAPRYVCFCCVPIPRLPVYWSGWCSRTWYSIPS